MMKKILKELKKYKYTTLAIILFLVLIVIAYVCYGLLFGSRGVPQYGNRLDGIEAVKPSKDTLDNSASELKKKYDFIADIDVSLSGKIINYVITVNDGTTAVKAKEMITKVVDTYTNDQIAYFDFQVFVTNENAETKGFPIIGYKNKENKVFSYSQANKE